MNARSNPMTIARPLARPIVHVAGGWLARQIAALTAADGTKPAAIADFENWRFAIPKLGSNLIEDGGFDNGISGWVGANSGVLSHVSGRLRVTNGIAGEGRAEYDIPVETGKLYRVVLSATGRTTGGGRRRRFRPRCRRTSWSRGARSSARPGRSASSPRRTAARRSRRSPVRG